MGRANIVLASRLRQAVAQHPTELKTDGAVLRCIPCEKAISGDRKTYVWNNLFLEKVLQKSQQYFF